MEPMDVSTKAYQVIDRPVKAMGNSGGIYLPKEWIGKQVKVLLIEPIERSGDSPQ
jgi:putative transposon-encoded protein